MNPFQVFASIRVLVGLTLLGLASFGQAQTSPPRAERADPLDPQARVPALVYRSPLAQYRRLGELTPVPWSQANETVNRIGGWRAYQREAQQPERTEAPASGAASASPAAPAQPVGGAARPGRAGHAGH